MFAPLPDEKAALRRRIRALPPVADAERCDRMIAERVLLLPEIRQAKQIFCYYSVADEVDTRFLLARWLAEGKRLALPRCASGGVMAFYETEDLASLVPGRFHIPEPPENAALCRPMPGDAAIVPCAACDCQGSRLGRGGGYYDRWLAKNPVFSVVLCRSARQFERIPTGPYDYRPDIIVTEKGELRNGAQ